MPLAILGELKPVPASFLKQLAANRDLFQDLPLGVQRQVLCPVLACSFVVTYAPLKLYHVSRDMTLSLMLTCTNPNRYGQFICPCVRYKGTGVAEWALWLGL